MSKWKCGICNSEFENYHAQGFDNIIYCPLCYYKELYKRDKKEIDRLNHIIKEAIKATKDVKQFVYDELVDRNVSGATETHCKIMDLLDILNKGSDK